MPMTSKCLVGIQNHAFSMALNSDQPFNSRLSLTCDKIQAAQAQPLQDLDNKYYTTCDFH